MIGRALSHYRVVEKLGAGGMGEVYRARDEKLGRDVALKVLPSGALADEEARRRFRREAEALSRLSHPHVATLFDFDTADGTDFLVMELVVGPTLAEELRKGPLAEKDVVRLGAQLARGLQAAHEHGVVHRDLKPSNLQLTSDGLLKILDFGVAHLERAALSVGEATATETEAGEVLGSPPYMAPEQLLGKGVDTRTDLYGAGVCLYELATGKRPYGERRGAALTEAILHEAPVSPRVANPALSPGLEAVLLKAMDKDPGLRYQTTKELLVDLERLQVAATSGAARQPVAVVKSRRRWPWLASAVALVAFATVAWLLRPPPAPRVTGIRPLTLGLPAAPIHGHSLVTDGLRVYYACVKDGRWGLFQIPVTGGEPTPIPVPFDGPLRVMDYSPLDSSLLIGTEPVPFGWALWSLPVSGGAPRRLGDLRGGAAFSPDDRRIAAANVIDRRVVVANADGTSPRPVATLAPQVRSAGAVQPRWAPDGRTLRLMADGPPGHEGNAWVWEIAIDSGTVRPLWAGGLGAWTRDGRAYVFVRPSGPGQAVDLWAAREDGIGIGRPRQFTRLTFGPHSFYWPVTSRDGRQILAVGRESRAELVRWDSGRRRFEPFLGGGSHGMVDVSPDGAWLAWVGYPEGTLWRARRDGSERLQLSARAFLPHWSPDGTRLVFVSGEDLSVRVVGVAGSAETVVARPSSGESYWDPCWLPDGRTVLFSNLTNGQPRGIHRVDVDSLRHDVLPGTEQIQYPKCGRQGQLLASRVPRQGDTPPPDGYGLVVLRPGGRSWETLGDLPWVYPQWSSDGKTLYGLNLRNRTVQRLWLDGRKLEDVADADFALAQWMYVPWFGLDSGDTPLLMADRDRRELYALDWQAP